VRSQAVGNGGNINITTSSLSLTDLAQIAASTSGQGDAGSVSVRASDSVSVATAAIFSTVEAGGVGNGGNININAATVSLFDSAQLLTIVREASNTQPAGRGDAGNVTVNVTGKVTIAGVKDGFDDGIFSSVRTGATGNGGNITISSGSFSLTDGGTLAASTYGQGNAGSVSVRATDSVELAGGATISSNVEEGGVGKGGNININAATVSLFDSAQLQTLVREASDNQPAGRGDAGNVTVDVTGKVTIAGAKDGSASGISSRVRTGATGNGGNITISSGSLSLSDGALLIASTYGQGNAGNVSVQATDSVELSGGSMTGIVSTVESGAVGNGGNINISAATLSLFDDAQLQTLVRGASDTQPAGRGNAGNVTVNVTGKVTIAGVKEGFPSAVVSAVGTGATGNGGNITISSGSLSLSDGAQLFASTYGQGNAGNVSVRATDSVELANTAGIFSAVEPGGVGKGGNININAASVSLKDGAGITASSAGNGTAGNIEVAARSMRLDNGSIISANTVAGQGNINLRARDLLLLRRGSNITTNATGTATGGNITINTPSGFIIAIPNENSDINANAFTGAGGRVDITTQGIYGIESRPRQTFLSDITASSERGISGKVTINRPDVDESLGLVELPTVLAGTSELIAETSCAAVASTDSDTEKINLLSPDVAVAS
jgi:large exoprotein involved in heme utilization and adhesion